MAYNILLVEDSPDMRENLASFLKNEGFKVSAVSSAEEGIDEVDEDVFDAGIVDINLPGKSGFELIEYIREQGIEMPLLAMTARDGIEDKLRGFNLGFTDYIVKPFNVRELHARLLVHLQGSAQSEDQPLKLGPYKINPKNMRFSIKNSFVELTQLEFRIMYLLMRNVNTLVLLDDLIEYVWGESGELVSPPIRIHIANLRRKIDDNNFDIIRTIPGKGYILEVN